MHAPIALTTLGSSLRGYDFVFLLCLLVFVHPEKLIDWLSDLAGKKFAIPSVRTFQVAALLVALIWALLMFAVSSRFRWFDFIAFVAAAALMRGIRAAIVSYFGFEKF